MSAHPFSAPVAYFDFLALKEHTITTCHCSTAPHVLLALGYFACSPVAPTLAVDLKLLEFARLQFLHLVPNTTGWCDAMESFLSGLFFKLTTRVSTYRLILPSSFINSEQNSLRRRFSNCLRWYYTLLDSTEVHIQNSLNVVRQDLLDGKHPAMSVAPSSSVSPSTPVLPPLSPSSPPLPSSPLPASSPPLASSPLPASSPPLPSSPPPDRDPFPDGPGSDTLERPSEYLRRRCHLCFGGKVVHDPSVL